MFEITPSPEFSAWFESLAEPLAERVAGALELVAGAVGLLSPAQVSSALLWYDGVGHDTGLALRLRFPEVTQSYPAVRELMLWRQEVIRCLESAVFIERLAALEPEPARIALSAVERVKRLLRAASTQLVLGRGHVRYVSSKVAIRSLHAPVAVAVPESALVQELEQAFRDALRLVGLDPGRVIGADSGLRELTIDNCTPKLHVLFGLDAPARRLLVLLGEPLNRQYYGDSVRLAEQRWAAYRASAQTETDSQSPAP